MCVCVSVCILIILVIFAVYQLTIKVGLSLFQAFPGIIPIIIITVIQI